MLLMRIFTFSLFLFFMLIEAPASFSQNAEALPQSIANKLPECSFQIQGIQSSHDGKYMAVSGLRKCNDVIYQEVSIYKSGTSLNSKICNTFLTENMKPIKSKWIGDKLYIYQAQHKKAILKETKVFGAVDVVYDNDVKSFY
jgi:hypothetical protein